VNGNLSGGAGFADSYYLPLILGWDEERAAVRVLWGFLAPTGRFAQGANSNVGSGYWTFTGSSGQTFYLTKSKSLNLSAYEMYEFHTTQEGTGTRPGDTFDLDYSLMRTFALARGSPRVQVGVAGYEARQTTAKTGPEITPTQIIDTLRGQRARVCSDPGVSHAKIELQHEILRGIRGPSDLPGVLVAIFRFGGILA
jgi:hypothetical protein